MCGTSALPDGQTYIYECRPIQVMEQPGAHHRTSRGRQGGASTSPRPSRTDSDNAERWSPGSAERQRPRGRLRPGTFHVRRAVAAVIIGRRQRHLVAERAGGGSRAGAKPASEANSPGGLVLIAVVIAVPPATSNPSH